MHLFVTLALAETGVPSSEPPVADAGLGLLALVGDTIQLNGTASSDPEGAELSFAWTQWGGPEVTLDGATTAEPTFEVPAPGTYRFALVVNDGVLDSEPDSVEFVVPERSFGGSAGGCSVAGGAPFALALAGALTALRRRQR